MTKYDKFIKERNAMLAKNSVEELTKYFKKWGSKEEYLAFKAARPIVKKATLCKMICAIDEFKDTKLYEDSAAWLKRHNMDIVKFREVPTNNGK